MAIKKRKTAEAWKKKEWYTIKAPKIFEEKDVGTTPADDPAKVLNRVLRVPLREITGNMNHQFVKLWLRVNDVKGKTAYTVLDGFEIVAEFLRRSTRRRRSMIRAIHTADTADGKTLQVIAYTFTARRTESSKKVIIRKAMTDFLETMIRQGHFEQVIQKLLFGTAATELFRQIKSIAPIKRVEITKCEVLRTGK